MKRPSCPSTLHTFSFDFGHTATRHPGKASASRCEKGFSWRWFKCDDECEAARCAACYAGDRNCCFFGKGFSTGDFIENQPKEILVDAFLREDFHENAGPYAIRSSNNPLRRRRKPFDGEKGPECCINAANVNVELVLTSR